MLSALPVMVGPTESIVLHLGNGQKPIPFVDLDLDDLFIFVTSKARSESSSIIAEETLILADMVRTAKEQGPEQAKKCRLCAWFCFCKLFGSSCCKSC